MRNGPYTVVLTITNSVGDTSTASLVIIVNPGGYYLVWDVGNWNQANWAPVGLVLERVNQMGLEVCGSQ
jgi:hypothetical protein